MATENWYVQNKSRIMRDVGFIIPHFRKQFVEAFGKEEGEAIASEGACRFEALLPDIPHIGGDENVLTRDMYLTAGMLAMYRSLRAHGATFEESARLLCNGTASFFGSLPTRWLMRWQGRRMFSQRTIAAYRRAAAMSQQRRYPDDWVCEIVDGDGQSFKLGADYTECGTVKYLSKNGAPELAPVLCWGDYPKFAAMHVRLMRTETLAEGGQRCDFRFSRGQPVEVEPLFTHAHVEQGR